MGIGYLYPDGDGEKFSANGDLPARAGHLHLIQGLVLVVEGLVSSHTHNMPNNLGPVAVHAMAHLTMSLDIFSWLETCGALGTI